MEKRVFTCFLLYFAILSLCSAKPRNILFIVADDLGWNDVGFHNPDMITPNIDKLAYSGIILNKSYVQPVCTPSRNSWMSGYYPFRSGLQHGALLPKQAVCAPLNRTFLPQELKKLDYATHMIGKWHLGFCSWDCTPTYRGFDSFFGYYNGAEDYYSHVIQKGKDFRADKIPVEADGEYSAHLYAKKAQKIIQDHNLNHSLFLYLPFQSVHEPIQVPKKYEDMYEHIKNKNRRQYSGMVTAMDEAIGNITQALKDRNMFDDTLILFTADNGGWPTFAGNNYPLRGSKITIFEGGTRAASFITGSGIDAKNKTYDGMLHAVDWMPTLVAAAGGSISNPDMDGINQWDNIRNLRPSDRTGFVYNLDDKFPPVNGHAAIRYMYNAPNIFNVSDFAEMQVKLSLGASFAVEIVGHTVEELISVSKHGSSRPSVPVNVVGGVVVYIEPKNYPAADFQLDGPWKVAAGVHPKHYQKFSTAKRLALNGLLEHPKVAALGEIGLDRTIPPGEWRAQELVFENVLRMSKPELPLVLHLRGPSGDTYGSDVTGRCQAIMRRVCRREQKIHVHCFTGLSQVVNDWLSDFPNTFFGVTAAVRRFDEEQKSGLRAIPRNRLLLETDAPYFPVGNVPYSTPAYLGDTAAFVAVYLNIGPCDLMQLTLRNAMTLYGS
ncbi:hypothetical protein FSP39_018311 [Pinctada imbricata]|uniref:Sulfatase N-terminal domain-containing protein n=1 Tax=Pinctada imbricata TaxID=66713 RepID=A0AA88YNG3_PINIB|nr:hypothetical protein FSP39_018311 [Pinctada imbricata]